MNGLSLGLIGGTLGILGGLAGSTIGILCALKGIAKIKNKPFAITASVVLIGWVFAFLTVLFAAPPHAKAWVWAGYGLTFPFVLLAFLGAVVKREDLGKKNKSLSNELI